MAQDVSTWWRDGRQGAQEQYGYVELLTTAGAVFKTSDQLDAEPFVVSDCTITEDRGRSTWGSCSLTMLVPWDAAQSVLDLLPTEPTAPLSPISSVTFRPHLGFINPYTGAPETVPCGRYDIEECDVEETEAGIVVQLEGVDLLGRLDVADIPQPVDLAWGGKVIEAAKFLVSTVIPWIQFHEDATEHTMGRVVLDQQANRLAEVRSMMTSIGFEAYMNLTGTHVEMRRIPTTSDVPQWVFEPSRELRIVALGNQMDRSRVYNGVIANGENPNSLDIPVRGEAWITDTSDPTHYVPTLPVQTIIGPRPYFMTSKYIATSAQAQEAAEMQLRRLRGLLQQVRVTMPVDPAVNVGDVIDLYRPDIGILGRYVVNTRSFSFDGSPMMLTCEERRISTDEF